MTLKTLLIPRERPPIQLVEPNGASASPTHRQSPPIQVFEPRGASARFSSSCLSWR